jgi:hypothetical protein
MPIVRLLFLVALLGCNSPIQPKANTTQPVAAPAAPRLFYSDLLNGPSTGGENNQGAFVTLYGNGFGAARGSSTVTLGLHEVYAYRSWSNNKIIIQLGGKAESGSITVHVSGMPDTNVLPFTVRHGRIYFVSTQGKDEYPGDFRKPWRNLVEAKNRLNAGDILYAMDGVKQDTLDKYDSAFSIQTSGTEDKPIALIAYPGATVTIGAVTGPSISARTPNIDRTSDHWVLAGLTFVGSQEALDVTASKDWRVIGNEFTCPQGFGPTGCIEFGQAEQVAFLGNFVHDVAKPRTTKQYHAVYFTTDSNHIDFGWNTIANVRGCRALQFHSSPLDPGTGHNQFDLHIHDNRIHDIACDAINLATIDPSKGPIEIYNNLIYDVGTGPDPEDGSADYACIYVQGGANAGPVGSGTVQIYNNTFFNCGGRKNTDSGGFSFSGGSPQQFVSLRNNIIVLSDGVTLLSPNSTNASLKLGKNLCWPASSCETSRDKFVVRNPLLRATASGDFRPEPSSPAIGAADSQFPGWDLFGIPRPDGHADFGAIQYAGASAR